MNSRVVPPFPESPRKFLVGNFIGLPRKPSYLALYRSARMERAVPAPQMILFSFEKLVNSYETSVYFKTIHSGEGKTAFPVESAST